MDLCKQFIERLGKKLTHHDLIVIENALDNQFIDLQIQYNNLSKSVQGETSSHSIKSMMRCLCLLYDEMIDIRTVLKCFEDIRKEDHKNGSYK